MASNNWAQQGFSSPEGSSLQMSFAQVYDHDGPKPALIVRGDMPWLDTASARPDTKEQQSADNDQPEPNDMSTQDRYIDARLAGIESKLDARVDGVREAVARMQKGFDDAERRFERVSDKHDTELALSRQQIQQEFRDARRHATGTAWATVGGVFAVMAIIIGLFAYWITEQGSYAKSYGETQVEIQQATEERAEFREAVQSIQQTQQSILERLPAPQEPPAQ